MKKTDVFDVSICEYYIYITHNHYKMIPLYHSF